MEFDLDRTYTRDRICELLGVPDKSRGGDWNTGYHLHNGEDGEEHFVFANVGSAGRTGHDYENSLSAGVFNWEGKTGAKLRHASIQKMLATNALVHLFVRFQDRDPFEYKGRIIAESYNDTVPVSVVWRLKESARGTESRSGDHRQEGESVAPPAVRTAADDIAAMRPLIAAVFQISRSMRALAPEYSWGGLGNFLGAYGEYVAIRAYGFDKAASGSKGFDAVDDTGKKVEIKANRESSTIGFRVDPDPDLFLALHIQENGDWDEIYYGDFAAVKAISFFSQRDNKYVVSVTKLRRLSNELEST